MTRSHWLTAIIITGVFLLAASCGTSPVSLENNTSDNYPIREYSLERNPNVNVWGAGLNFINAQNNKESSDLDIRYLVENDTFAYDIKFYTVKVYFNDGSGNVKSEGCPAMLLSGNSRGCQIGTGIDFFSSYTVAAQTDINKLDHEPMVNYASCLNGKGQHDRDLLFAEIDKCIIGQRFRTVRLVIPEGKTESEVQPVFLIETADKGYVKFMVKRFKGDPPNEQKTTVIWQILSVKN